MGKYKFDYRIISRGAAAVTINNLGISFNSTAISLLGSPEFVMLGYDSDQRVIGIRSYDGGDSKAYRFASRVRNGWIRIGCKAFIRYIGMHTKTTNIRADIDRETKTLIIRLEKGKNGGR